MCFGGKASFRTFSTAANRLTDSKPNYVTAWSAFQWLKLASCTWTEYLSLIAKMKYGGRVIFSLKGQNLFDWKAKFAITTNIRITKSLSSSITGPRCLSPGCLSRICWNLALSYWAACCRRWGLRLWMVKLTMSVFIRPRTPKISLGEEWGSC